MSRGSLIWPFLAEVSPIDTKATDALGRYDYRMREPKKLSDGTEERVEGATYKLPCQFETEADPFENLRMAGSGDSPTSSVKCAFHFEDLEDMGLVDDRGVATIRKHDRLLAVYDCDEVLVQEFSDVPLYATEVRPESFGLSSLRRNLLVVTFSRRETSTLDVT